MIWCLKAVFCAGFPQRKRIKVKFQRKFTRLRGRNWNVTIWMNSFLISTMPLVTSLFLNNLCIPPSSNIYRHFLLIYIIYSLFGFSLSLLFCCFLECCWAWLALIVLSIIGEWYINFKCFGTEKVYTCFTETKRQNNGKASILVDATRLLQELLLQVECLKRENASLLSESRYVSSKTYALPSDELLVVRTWNLFWNCIITVK